MKICPVCKAACYDDMEMCFGCLHSFAREEIPTGSGIVPESEGQSQATALFAADAKSEEETAAGIWSGDDIARIAVETDPFSPNTIKRITVEIGFPLKEGVLEQTTV